MHQGLKYFLLILICFLCFTSIKASTIDTAQVHSLNRKSAQVFLTHPDSALLYATQALNASEESNYYYGEGISYLHISHAQWVFSNYEMSLTNAFKALEVFDSLQDQKMQFETFIALGRTYLDRKDLKDAEEYYQKAYLIAEESNNRSFLATIQRNLGILNTRKKSYSRALAYSLDALKLCKELDLKGDEAILYNNIGTIHSLEGNYAVAQDYFSKALTMSVEIGNRRLEALTYARLSALSLKLKSPKEAIEYGEKALAIAQKIQTKDPIILALGNLVDAHTATREFEKALKYSLQFQQYKDSIYNIEKDRIAANIYQSYAVESQQREIKLLSKENDLKKQEARNQKLYIFSLIGGLVLALTLVTVLFKSFNTSRNSNLELQHKNEEIEASKNEISRQAASLQSLNQVKDKLFSIIGHDLKGPIGNLQAILKMLNNQNITQEEFIFLTQNLKKNVDNTRITLDNLLNWSLSQMDGIQTRPEKIMLKSCVEQSAALFMDVADNKKITLDIKINQEIEVFADQTQLNLIIRNLVSNAIKFTPQNGKITVDAELNHKQVLISIADTGIGMDASQVANLLEPGTHPSQEGTEKEKGTGLGLMLCKDFIERNGGTLKVESKPGKGSTFQFALPLA